MIYKPDGQPNYRRAMLACYVGGLLSAILGLLCLMVAMFDLLTYDDMTPFCFMWVAGTSATFLSLNLRKAAADYRSKMENQTNDIDHV